MAIRIEFEDYLQAGKRVYNPQEPTFVLMTRSGKKLGLVPASEIVIKCPLNAADELSFSVHKTIDETDASTIIWNELTDFKLIWCREWNKIFQIAVEIDEGDGLTKYVSATGLGEAETSQAYLYDIQINTEEDIAREDYVRPTVIYDVDNPDSSLLNRITEKLPHYVIAHVDEQIGGESTNTLQRVFSFDNTSIYDAFQQIAQEIKCLFDINCYIDNEGEIRREINVYDLETYGHDTAIFVSTDNLTDEVRYSTDIGSVKNCFRLVAGDDLMTATIANCNPNGSGYIWYISEEMKRDMSPELVAKLAEYDNLYDYYQDEYELDISDYAEQYNAVINDYSAYTSDYPTMPSELTGYPAIMEAYYNAVDFYYFLMDELMPAPVINNTNAAQELGKLTASNLGSIAVPDLSVASIPTVESAIKGMARVIVNSAYSIDCSTVSYNNNIWTGRFTVTNYGDEEDTATSSSTITITITENYEDFVKQKIDKKLQQKIRDDATDIITLFKYNDTNFTRALDEYALNPLLKIRDCCQTCLDVLIEQGIADNGGTWAGHDGELYTNLYLAYYQKLTILDTEIAARENEIATITGTYNKDGSKLRKGLLDALEDGRNDIQDSLNFQNYLGEELWYEFSAYRREDTYQNNNYISDGLNNLEMFSAALEFIETARKDIYESAVLQHSISSTLANLLVMEEFEPIVDNFELGNWLRVSIDNEVYRLRLIEYEVDFDNLENITVTFSDVTRTADGAKDVNSILKQAVSMATSFGAVARQAKSGYEGKSILNNWAREGMSLAQMKIVENPQNQNIVYDDHGILAREYLPITDTYDNKQLKIINKGLYTTDDGWLTAKAGIGNFVFWNPKTNQYEEAYGVIADTLVGNLILSEEVGVYNQTGSVSIDENGIKIIADTTQGPNTQSITIQKKTTSGGQTYLTNIFYVDSNGNLQLGGGNTVLVDGSPVATEEMLESIQAEIDSAIATYTGSAVPTLNNYPASAWTDNTQRAKHVGDIYYVLNDGSDSDGHCYRFAFDNASNSYKWVLIQDSDVTTALGRISDLEEFESTTSSWISNTDNELSSIKSNHTTLVGRVDKTLVSTTQLWYTKADTTSPNKPTAHVTSTSTSGNAWRTVVPAYDSNYPNYYYCYEWKYSDGTYGWSDVTRDIGMAETQSTARVANATADTAVSNAATAQSTANSAASAAATADGKAVAAQDTANANIKSAVQLWFTKANATAPNKPTSHVTTNNASTFNAWNIAVPTYNDSYPYYFYCYEYQKGDGSYTWSDVVYDRATTENQKNSHDALTAVATKVEKSVFNELSQTVDSNTATITSLSNTVDTKADSSTVTTLSNTVNSVQQTANSNSSKITNLTTVLGTNADGTTSANDIVHKVSEIDQDLDSITTRVGKTETWQNNFQVGGRNYALNSKNIIDRIGSASGSRLEYYPYDLGRALPLDGGTPIVISFDLYMVVATANPSLQVYNTNNPGPHMPVIGTTNALAGETHAVGEIIEKRCVVKGTLGNNASPTTTHDFIEFYSIYNSNNFYRISNLKLETGNIATDWSPAPEDIEARVTTAETSITQNANAIALRATKTEVTEAINNIEVGGRNLLKDTSEALSETVLASKTINSDVYVMSDFGETWRADATTSDQYSLSFDYEITDSSTSGSITPKLYGINCTSQNWSNSNKKGHYSITNTLTNSQISSMAKIEDTSPYSYRQPPNNFGKEVDLTVVGGSVGWNQLVYNNQTATLSMPNSRTLNVSTNYKASVVNHIYCYSCSITADTTASGFNAEYGGIVNFGQGTGTKTKIVKCTAAMSYIYAYIGSSESSGASLTYKDFNIIDLTALFGSTIADHLYSLETANAGAGVALFKQMFPKSYYPYNAGSLLSVKTSGRKTVGFNVWDEEWEVGGLIWATGAEYAISTSRRTDYIRVIPNATYYVHSPYACGVVWFDSNKQYITNATNIHNTTTTAPSNAYYGRFVWTSVGDGTTYNNDICINISGDRNGQYEPYTSHTYPMSNIDLRGVFKLADGKIYCDGDVYSYDGSVTRRYGIVDMGTLTYTYNSSNARFDVGTISPTPISVNQRDIANAICSKYRTVSFDTLYAGADKTIAFDGVWLRVKDSAYTDATAFKNSLSGTYLVYEKASPTTETADPYQHLQFVGSTEEFLDDREVAVPVGQNSKYTSYDNAVRFLLSETSGNKADINISNIKLETGNKATDWTPAPEDLEAYTDSVVSDAKAEIKVTTDSISSEVSKVSSAKYVTSSTPSWQLTSIKTFAAEGHVENWNVTSTANLRVGDTVYVTGTDSTRNCKIYIKTTVTAVNSGTQFTGTSHGYEDVLPVETIKSTINQSADSVKIAANHVDIEGATIFSSGRLSQTSLNNAYDAKGAASAVQTNLDNLAVGGRNLLVNSSNGKGWLYSTFSKNNDGVVYTRSVTGTTESYVSGIYMQFEPQETYTLSAWIKSNGYVRNVDFFKVHYSGSGSHQSKINIYPTTEYQKYVWTFVCNATAAEQAYIRFDNNGSTVDGTEAILYVKNPKLEKGNQSTDWTPAPEDALDKSQPIYYRSNSSTLPAAPTAIVTRSDDINSTWTTRHVAAVDKNNTSFKYCYTCNQLISVGGYFLGTTPVVQDDGATVIDGSYIQTGTISANRINVNELISKTSSAGEQLVANGNGILGDNTNFSQFVFDGAVANDSPGSFTNALYTGGPHTTCDNYFPIDTSKRYRFEFDAKSKNGLATMYSMVITYDAGKNIINASSHMYISNPDTLTTLARELKAGDTVVYLTNASNYRTIGTQGHQRMFIFWDYKNKYGYQYPAKTYSNYYLFSAWTDDNSINKTNNTITLATAYSGPTHPAGTYVSQGYSGSTYKYQGIRGAVVPTTWTHYVGYYDGVDYSGTNVENKFPPATAFGKVGFLWNYNNANDQIWVTNIQVYEDYKTDIDNALSTANNAAPKSSAVAEEQYIYISKASGVSSVSEYTTWVTESGDKQNTWSTKRPTYNSSYPVLFVAKQRKVVSGTVTCTTPVKDDTTTVIDGGHITTGTIDASKATITNINASNITAGTISTEVIQGATLFTSGRLSQTSLNDAYDAKGAALDVVTAKDTRSTNESPQWYITNYPKRRVQEFKGSATIGITNVETYCWLQTDVPWGDSSGGWPKQMAEVNGRQYWRHGTSATAWSAWVDAYGTAATAKSTADAAAPKSSAIAEEQRIYYRSKVNTKPSGNALPTAWITNTGDVWNDTATVAAATGWTRKVTPIANGTGSSVTKYLYLWTCIQKKTVSGTVTYTDILLDDSITVIDGGNIVTGTIDANRLNATSVNASGVLTVGALSNDAQSKVLNSNISVGGRNLAKGTNVIRTWTSGNSTSYGDSIICNDISAGSTVTISVRIDADNVVWGSSGSQRIGCEFFIAKTGGGYQYIGAWAGSAPSDASNIVKVFTGSFHGRISKTFVLEGNITAASNTVIYTYGQGFTSGTVKISNIKLELGNVATDWTPAPEDTIIGGRNLIKGTDPSTVIERAFPSSSSASYCEGYTPIITRVDGVSEYVASFDAKASVNNLEVICYWYNPNTTTHGESSTGQTSYNANGSDGNTKITLTTSWKRYWVKWKQSDTASTNKNLILCRQFTKPTSGTNTVYIRAPKMEVGNSPTAWSPAPEDVYAREQIIYYRTNSTSLPQAPSTWVANSDTRNSDWTTKKMPYDSTYKYLYTCLQSQKSTGEIVNSTVTRDETITIIDGGNIITESITADKINATSINASKVLTVGALSDSAQSSVLNSNIEIGGRNLLKKSNEYRSNGDYLINSYYFGDNPPKHGETVTMQIKGQLADTKTRWGIYNSGGYVNPLNILKTDYNANTGIYTTTGTWLTSSGSYTANNTFVSIYVIASSQSGTSTIEWVKLEKGNKATDWTPAPEDLPADLASATGTTVINGAHITTGTIDANKINASSGTFNTANIPNLSAAKITTGIIKDSVNKNSWDLDSGTLTIKSGSINITTSSDSNDYIKLLNSNADTYSSISSNQFTHSTSSSTKLASKTYNRALTNIGSFNQKMGSDTYQEYGLTITGGAGNSSLYWGYPYSTLLTPETVSVTKSNSDGTQSSSGMSANGISTGGTVTAATYKDTSGNTITDYIIAQGTSSVTGGNWYYRKWYQGRYECWFRSSSALSVSVTSSWAGHYYGTISTIDFPITFIDYPVMQVTVQAASGGAWAAPDFPSKSQTGPIYMYRPTSSTVSCYVNIYAQGRWK